MKNSLRGIQRACQDLNVAIITPFALAIHDGQKIEAFALMPELGGPKGIIVVHRYDDLKGFAREVWDMGYAYSVLSEPSVDEAYDLASYVEMFTDWGWGSVTSPKPKWMK